MFRPGDQIDPNGASPFVNQDFHDIRPQFQPATPAQSSGGGSDDVWWPPKPAFKVTFQPNFTDPWITADKITAWLLESETDGWFSDHGDDYGARTNSVTGGTAEFGWRCAPEINWHGNGYLIDKDYTKPAYSWGVVKDVGVHRTSLGVRVPHCPDGRPNVWEVEVPNGLYMVTVAHAMDLNNPSFDGCTYENIRQVITLSLSLSHPTPPV